MLPSVDLVQFHVDKISAPVYYFGCCFYWSFSDHRVLCPFQIFLFHLRILLLRTFFSIFPWSIPIYIGWNSIILVIFPSFLLHRLRLYCYVDFVFLVLSVMYFSSCQFHEFCDFFSCLFRELLWFFVC